MEPGRLPEIPIWFPGAKLNYAENLLYRRDDGIALTEAGEKGIMSQVSFRELNERVRAMAAALRMSGLQVGDRVAGEAFPRLSQGGSRLNLLSIAIVTNSVNAVVIALATASIGGIFSSTATDMGTQANCDFYTCCPQLTGVQGVLDRYRQIQPKFVFAETETLYAGKVIDLRPKVSEVIKDLSSKGLKHAVLLPSRITGKELHIPDMSKRWADC